MLGLVLLGHPVRLDDLRQTHGHLVRRVLITCLQETLATLQHHTRALQPRPMPPKRGAASGRAKAPKKRRPAADWRVPLFYWRGTVDDRVWRCALTNRWPRLEAVDPSALPLSEQLSVSDLDPGMR